MLVKGRQNPLGDFQAVYRAVPTLFAICIVLYLTFDRVDIYIVDTGVNDLPDFEGRLQQGKSYVPGGSFDDVADHGTKVASFAASGTYGTAKKATLWSYKVSNTNSALDEEVVRKAIADIVNADKIRRRSSGYKGAVINLSMDIIDTDKLETIIAIAHANKITVVAAAGNDNLLAKESVPCKYNLVICVGAINNQWDRADFSNHGDRVDVFAPGDYVTGYDRTGAVRNDLRGTSYAAPYVAGIVATFYGREGRVEGSDRDGYK